MNHELTLDQHGQLIRVLPTDRSWILINNTCIRLDAIRTRNTPTDTPLLWGRWTRM